MTRWQKLIRSLVLAMIALTALAGAAIAQEDVQYTWSPPSTGSIVEHYVVEHSVDGGAFVEIAQVSAATYTLSADFEQEHRVRVAGVDSWGRKGAYSEASDPYTPSLGAPGQPGKPVALF